MQLYRLGGAYVASQGPTFDDEHRDVDLGLDVSAVAEHEDIISPNLAAKAPIDTKSPFEMELAFEMGAASKQRGNFGYWNGRIHSSADFYLDSVGLRYWKLRGEMGLPR